MKKSKLPLSIKILIGLFIGIVIGLLCINGGPFDRIFFSSKDMTALKMLQEYIKPIGDIFLNLLKFVVVPIVLLSIISGIISLSDIKKVWSIGIKTIMFYLCTTFIALVIGIIIANIFKSKFALIDVSGATYEAAATKNFIKVIADMFPTNIVAPLLNASMLQVIVIALFIGFAIIIVGEKAKTFADLIESANAVFIEIMDMIIHFSPIGVLCLIAPVVAENGPKVLGSLALVIGIAYLGYIIHMVLTYSTMVSFFTRKTPFEFFKGIYPAMVMAFSSASSVGTLPLNIECTKKLGGKADIVSFVLPLGATINMDGTAIYQAVSTIFIASCYGVNLSFTQLVTVVVTATVASIGTAGVPGAGVVMLAMVLQAVGLPVDGIALVLGVDMIFDMGRTVVNITGDAACSLCVSSIETKGKTAKK
ncbi:MAG: dicarboxylate/amino acid:cation symporter [Lachnospiraceae bacterium]|nr:dicarboxylate/amino acid:cation symporter [Lachnospiraceae bacterium]